MFRFRIGCVPYLNAKPLIAYYQGREVAEVILSPPSQLANLLETNQADVALASSFFAIDSGYRIAPGASISSQGAVDSVRLFSKTPFGDIRSLALDAGSMTSSHLVQIILAKRYDCFPRTSVCRPELTEMLQQHDAALLIGDSGMDAVGSGLYILDLGAAWNDLAGLPFVWALWLGKEKLDKELCDSLASAKKWGMERLDEIAQTESARLGWPKSRCLRYLAEVIDYDLTERHFEGLALFARYCFEMGFTKSSFIPSPQKAGRN